MPLPIPATHNVPPSPSLTPMHKPRSTARRRHLPSSPIGAVAQVHSASPAVSSAATTALQAVTAPAHAQVEVTPAPPQAVAATGLPPEPSHSTPNLGASTPTVADPAPQPELIAGLEPAPGSPEALSLLAAAGVSPRPAPGEPLGPDDARFSPVAIGHLTHRLVEVKTLLDQLGAEQKDLHDTLRLAHLRGDLMHLLAPGSEGYTYQLPDGVLLTRRQGRKQWSYGPTWADLQAQVKARQLYEQSSGEAVWRYGSAFWELRWGKG